MFKAISAVRIFEVLLREGRTSDGAWLVPHEVKSIEVLVTPVSSGAHAPSLRFTEPLLPSAGSFPCVGKS